jgi:hypothetical protein
MAGEENGKSEETQSPDEFVRLSPSGIRDWFLILTKRVIEAGSQARLDKYRIPGLPEEVVADQLIRNKAAVAVIIGALAGLGTSTTQLFAIPTFGATLAIWGGVALVEMGGLSLLQLRMVQDLSALYNVKLDPDDPQDMLTIFSFALGIKPSEALAPAVAKMAGETAKRAIKKFISKDMLKAIQRLAAMVGIRLLQRTIIKYLSPVCRWLLARSSTMCLLALSGKLPRFTLAEEASSLTCLERWEPRPHIMPLFLPLHFTLQSWIRGLPSKNRTSTALSIRF